MLTQRLPWRVLTALSVAGAVVSLAVACGDEASPAEASPDGSTEDAATADAVATDDAAPASDISAFCNDTLGRYAPRYAECCDATAAPKRYALDSKLLQAVGLGCTVTLGKSIDSGRATLSPTAAATCRENVASDIARRPCAEVLHDPTNQPSPSIFKGAAGCVDALAGKQPVDAPCSNDYECGDGLTCVGWTPTTDGACKTPPAEGALCGFAIPDGGGFLELVRWGFGNHPRCATGLYCDATSTQQGTCRARKAADASCDDHDECADGLRCQLGVCSTTQPAPADAPCRRGSDCQDRLFCKSGDGGSACATPGTAGTSCGNEYGSECQGTCVKPDGGGAATCVAYCGAP